MRGLRPGRQLGIQDLVAVVPEHRLQRDAAQEVRAAEIPRPDQGRLVDDLDAGLHRGQCLCGRAGRVLRIGNLHDGTVSGAQLGEEGLFPGVALSGQQLERGVDIAQLQRRVQMRQVQRCQVHARQVVDDVGGRQHQALGITVHQHTPGNTLDAPVGTSPPDPSTAPPLERILIHPGISVAPIGRWGEPGDPRGCVACLRLGACALGSIRYFASNAPEGFGRWPRKKLGVHSLMSDCDPFGRFPGFSNGAGTPRQPCRSAFSQANAETASSATANRYVS